MGEILGNATGGFGFPKTYILTDESGAEFTGILVDQETIFTATDNDVREGSVYASENGVSTGTKVIPSYHTCEGCKLIPNGSEFILTIEYYDYTKLQGIICTYNTSLANSVAAEKVAINNNLYDVQSTVVLSPITIDDENQWVRFGITNKTGKPCLIRYFSYKEIY